MLRPCYRRPDILHNLLGSCEIREVLSESGQVGPALGPCRHLAHPSRAMSAELRLLEARESHAGGAAPPPRRTRRRRGALLRRLLTDTFLPVGYPASVRADYLEYQLWDMAQGLCTYLRFTLAIRALLSGLGVGDAAASAVSGTLLWAAKDGAAMIATLAFSWATAADIGRNIRQWRLLSDVANDAMLLLQVLAPSFGPRGFAAATCASSICGALCGVAARASKTSISDHFALPPPTGSLADVVTKDGAQETGVQLIGLAGGAALLRWLGTATKPDTVRLWGAFVFLTVAHLYSSLRAVRTLRFTRLNDLRLKILLAAWRAPAGDMSVVSVSAAEPRLPPRPRAPRILLGARMADAVAGVGTAPLAAALARARAAGDRFAVVVPGMGAVRTTFVLLGDGVGGEELLRAWFAAEGAIEKVATPRLEEGAALGRWEDFLSSLQENGWDTTRPLLRVDPWRYDWYDVE